MTACFPACGCALKESRKQNCHHFQGTFSWMRKNTGQSSLWMRIHLRSASGTHDHPLRPAQRGLRDQTVPRALSSSGLPACLPCGPLTVSGPLLSPRLAHQEYWTQGHESDGGQAGLDSTCVWNLETKRGKRKQQQTHRCREETEGHQRGEDWEDELKRGRG